MCSVYKTNATKLLNQLDRTIGWLKAVTLQKVSKIQSKILTKGNYSRPNNLFKLKIKGLHRQTLNNFCNWKPRFRSKRSEQCPKKAIKCLASLYRQRMVNMKTKCFRKLQSNSKNRFLIINYRPFWPLKLRHFSQNWTLKTLKKKMIVTFQSRQICL